MICIEKQDRAYECKAAIGFEYQSANLVLTRKNAERIITPKPE